jgi:hypothetical protein
MRSTFTTQQTEDFNLHGRGIVNLDKVRKGQLDLSKMPEAFKDFVDGLLNTAQ